MTSTIAAGIATATSCTAVVSKSRSDGGKVTMVSSRSRSVLRTPRCARVAVSRPASKAANASTSRSTSAARRTLGLEASGSMSTSASAGGVSLTSGFTDHCLVVATSDLLVG